MSNRATRRSSADVDERLRPPPDEAQLGEDEQLGITDLHAREYVGIVKRSAKRAVDDQLPDAAAAIAYYGFLAIPAVLLISVGVFSIFASPSAIESIVERLGSVMPAEAVALLESGLTRTAEEGGGLTMIVVGGLVAVWTASGAANAVIRALNRVHDTDESRGFVRQRLLGLIMVLVGIVAFALVFGLLVLGPKLSAWIGGAVGAEGAVRWAWFVGQWPILLVGLLVAFGAVLFLGPDVEHPRWRFLTVGAGIAVALWLAASGGFTIYVSLFGSYNQTWGSLAAVIIMLTWLWLSALALLFAAEVDSETERTRQRAAADA
jgi:membrane protein